MSERIPADIKKIFDHRITNGEWPADDAPATEHAPGVMSQAIDRADASAYDQLLTENDALRKVITELENTNADLRRQLTERTNSDGPKKDVPEEVERKKGGEG